MVTIGMMIAGRYEILDKIGTGGMSDVYKAKDLKLNRFVAIKVLKQEFAENKSFVSKFIVEAQAAAGLMHHNIVNVYDVGEEEGIHYIVMELVEGITLKKYIEKKVRLTSKEAISIAIQVAMGIEAAHNNHIIHRDIKPQNIIISKEGKVKVTDFGIAKAATSNTITSNAMGSVHYTSPEQARGGFSDEKSDIYSLGITMFEMVTGRVPFNGDTTVAIAIKHIQDPMPSPRSFVPDIPVSLDQIIMKCTQKNPDKRYQNMGLIIRDLKHSLIAPDENFVKIDTEDMAGKTRIVTDREQIKKPTAPIPPIEIEEEKKEEKQVVKAKQIERKKQVEVQPVSKKNTTPKKRREEPLDDYEEERISKKSKNQKGYDFNPTTDRILTTVTVVLAIIIGCLLLYFAGTVLGVFDSSSSTSTSSSDSSSETSSVISTSEDGETVPNVVGMTEAEATANLKNAGFTVEKEYAYSTEYQKGYVTKQSVEAESKAALESTITITISQGSEEVSVTMPDLLGMTQEEMEVVLEEEGLTLGTVEETYSTEYDEGLVCYQGFSAGTTLTSGTKVDVKISIGAEEIFYSCNLVIQTPTNYAGGNAVVLLQSADGSEQLWYSETVTSFPLTISLSNFPCTSSYGIVYVTYIKNVETTVTDADGNTSTQITQTTDQIQQSVQFTKQ